MYKDELLKYLKHLAEIYEALSKNTLEIAICGGTALNLAGLIERPTKDVDIVSPEVWPDAFKEAVKATASHFNLSKNWINQGPVDLLRMGLPEGFFERCESLSFTQHLTYLITSRIDQIYFKVYASIDRGGYHVSDLKLLSPQEDELVKAALWCFTHDNSIGFKLVAIDFFKQMDWANVAKQLEA